MMRWPDFGSSRPFFELFLTLISNGCLDETKETTKNKHTFWEMVYDLDNTQPAWVIELLVVWIHRRIQVVTEEKDNTHLTWNNIIPSVQTGSLTVSRAAEKCPQAVIEDLLPVALDLAEKSAYEQGSPPFRDAVWGFSFESNHPDLCQTIESSIHKALEQKAKKCPRELQNIVKDLLKRNSYFSNKILLRIFTAGAAHFSDQALTALKNEIWRLRCGTSDSSYWYARCLIGAIAPHLSNKRMQKLETIVLGYRSTWEQSESGFKYSGNAVYILAGKIPVNLLSLTGQKKMGELKRKFGNHNRSPQGITGGTVVSPIPPKAAKKMNDDQWKSALKKHNTNDRGHFSKDFLRGGAYELARSMEPFIKNEPARFARIAITLPQDTNPIYFDWILNSLSETNCSVTLKLSLATKIFKEHKIACGRSLANLLGSVSHHLDDKFLEMLHWLALEHPDPSREMWQPTDEDPTIYYGGGIYESGLNSVRGKAVHSIANLICKDEKYLKRFDKTLSLLLEEKTLSVKSCAVRLSYEIIRYDESRAVKLFLATTQLEPKLLSTLYSDHFLSWAIDQNFEPVKNSLLRLLRSNDDKEAEVGARLLTLAKLYGHPSDEYVKEALNGTPPRRLGVAKVVAKNVALANARHCCEPILIKLFSDPEHSIRTETTTCFRELSELNLSNFDRLIRAFSQSLSFKSNPSTLMRLLEKTKFQLPELTMDVCEDFIQQITKENTNAFSHNYIDSSHLETLVFRVYQQYQNKPLAVRALNLIDKMIISGFNKDRCMEQYER